MLKKCDSEWVVRYFGCLAKGRTLWICMEFCDGGSVSDVRSSTRCTLDDSLSPLPAPRLLRRPLMLLRGVVVVHTESPATGVEGNSAVSRLKTSESARGRGDGDAFSGHVSSKLASKGLQARPAPISHRAAVGVHGLEAVEFACGAPKVVESNIAVGGLLCGVTTCVTSLTSPAMRLQKLCVDSPAVTSMSAVSLSPPCSRRRRLRSLCSARKRQYSSLSKIFFVLLRPDACTSVFTA